MSKLAEIRLTVDLDADNLPTHIEWEDSEGRGNGPMPCQSMMLSLWKSKNRTTEAIDLWTKDTSVEELNLYFYQVLHKLADSYARATENRDVARRMHEFGNEFGDALGLVNSLDSVPDVENTMPLPEKGVTPIPE